MERRVVITGIGWVTPLGHDIEGVWKRMLAGESGVAPTTVFQADTFPTSFSAEVRSFSLRDFLGADAEKHRDASRNTGFALGAASVAWKNAGLGDYMGLDPTRIGVYLGGGEGPTDFGPFADATVVGTHDDEGNIVPLDTVRWAEFAMKHLHGAHELEQDPNMAGGHIAVQFGAAGPSMNTLT
ncbi:MAG: beta-ketoacyl-[acyl-carrier-protein] synthase II, partial [Planctomycetes bacterium]|nr:beta-ketoacyl-[acyl-carrier-protein] synthase II [Planctomycetota bacterium]